ncbi:MAG: SGNH/GDSL hydrolase family protein, partial [Planctomycetota bacterium]
MGLSLSLGMLVLCDILVGVAFCRDGDFRWWPLPPYSLVFHEDQLEYLSKEEWSYFQFDPELGWSLRPGGVGDDGLYRINSAGIRADREYALQPPPGVIRIAAFGDSFVHGDTVDNTETAMSLLQNSRADLEVLNFGVPAYGTDQAYLRYLRDGAPYHPDVVLIGLMVENLLRNVSAFRQTYHHATGIPLAKPRFRLGAGGTLELLPTPARSLPQLRAMIESRGPVDRLQESDYWVARAPWAYRDSPLFCSSLLRIVCAAYENSGRQHQPYYRDVASEPFRVTARVLQQFRESAMDGGAQRAYVLLLPHPDTVRGHLQGEPAYWRTMTDHLEAAGVPVIDLTPALVEAARRDGLDTLF